MGTTRRRGPKRRPATAAGVVAAVVLTLTLVAPGSADEARQLVDVEVRFAVENVNRSAVPCPSDGRAYEVVGRLVAPRAVLTSPNPPVTVWVPGGMLSERGPYRMKVGGGRYDVTARLADMGFASVTMDRLGFGNSGIPDGLMSCVGSDADVMDQVARHLRAGTYEADGVLPAPRFAAVTLAGHSFAGVLISVVGYSFDSVDGLMILASAFDAGGLPPTIVAETAARSTVCATGGEADHEGEPAGYFFPFLIGDQIFNEIDPDVKETFLGAAEREPCGIASLAQTLVINRARLGEITVPLLFVAADDDWFGFTGEVVQDQADLYTGSDDRTVAVIRGANHVVMLERGVVDGLTAAERFRVAVCEWLTPRGWRLEGNGCVPTRLPRSTSDTPSHAGAGGLDDTTPAPRNPETLPTTGAAGRLTLLGAALTLLLPLTARHRRQRVNGA